MIDVGSFFMVFCDAQADDAIDVLILGEHHALDLIADRRKADPLLLVIGLAEILAQLRELPFQISRQRQGHPVLGDVAAVFSGTEDDVESRLGCPIRHVSIDRQAIQPSSSIMVRMAVSCTTPSPKLPPTGLKTSR